MNEKPPHTPGPWFQSHRECADGMWRTEVYDNSGEVIASLAWYPVKQANGVIATARESNARVIAAAPDLLAALKGIIDGVDEYWMTDHPGAVDAAQDAIAKAEGKDTP